MPLVALPNRPVAGLDCAVELPRLPKRPDVVLVVPGVVVEEVVCVLAPPLIDATSH